MWECKSQAIPCRVLPTGRLYYMWWTDSFSVSYLGRLWKMLHLFLHIFILTLEVHRWEGRTRKTINGRGKVQIIYTCGERGMKGRRLVVAQSAAACLCALSAAFKPHFGWSTKTNLRRSRLPFGDSDSACCLEMDFLSPQCLLTSLTKHQGKRSWGTFHTSLHKRQKELCGARGARVDRGRGTPGASRMGYGPHRHWQEKRSNLNTVCWLVHGVVVTV